jgi:uncharacterized membrane protein
MSSLAKKETKVIVNATQSVASWSGPLPSPGTLQQYGDFLPGSPERILAMAERESAHRHTIEIEASKNSTLDTKQYHSAIVRGQWMAFMLVIVAMAAACYCAYIGQTAIGCVIAGTTLVSVVASIIGKRRT